VLTVLLVDDDPMVLRFCNVVLTTVSGLDVLQACDGTEAIQISDRHRGAVDLLLSDILMKTGLNGIQLAEILTSHYPRLKVLLMSGCDYEAPVLQKGWFFKTNYPVTILNGIDTNKFHCTHRYELKPAEMLTIGLVARFRPQKRVDRWAEVAAEVHKKNPNIKFLMVGDGPSDDLLRQRIKELNIEGVIELPGMLTDTYAAYKRIDIFLLTSDFEGLPLALLEAMSCGCVPVISNVGGIKQLDFGGIGYKFDDFNPSEIADKIVAYTQNPDQYFIESDRSRDFVIKYYSLTKQVNEIIDLYRELMK